MNELNENTRMNIRKYERFGEIGNKARIHHNEKFAAKGDTQ